jgi:SAM-dependent methyltransferase
VSALIRWMDRTFYPHLGSNWDDELFRREIASQLRPELTILDLGAGAGIVSQMNFRGMAARVCGIDPDERVRSNPYLDEAAVGVGESIPYPDESFDLVFADNVLEHLAAPDVVFDEVSRVLRPGGLFLAKTPNRWHYVALIARCTPHRFHQFLNQLRGRARADTFPTLYRANTRKDITRLAGAAGLVVRRIDLIEGRPEYLRVSAPTYAVGWVYERLVNVLPVLAPFRVVLTATLEKPRLPAPSARQSTPAATGAVT